MIALVGYWMFLLSATISMFFFGRKQERLFICVVVIATLCTMSINYRMSIISALPYVTIIDAALWGVGLYFVMYRDRYWPIWFSGFHLNTLATEVGAVAFPGTISALHANLAGAWALPALGTAAYGVVMDRRRLRA